MPRSLKASLSASGSESYGRERASHLAHRKMAGF